MSKSLLPLPPQLVEGTGHRPQAGMRNTAERPSLTRSFCCCHLSGGKHPCCRQSSPGDLGGSPSLWDYQLHYDTQSTKLPLWHFKNFLFFLQIKLTPATV